MVRRVQLLGHNRCRASFRSIRSRITALGAPIGCVLFAAAAGCGKAGPQPLSEEEVVAKVRPSVVEITGKRGKEVGGGTGAILDTRQALVLTNAHVIAGLTSLKIKFDNGATSTARVLGQAPCDDVAVLKVDTIPPSGVTATRIGTSSGVRKGQHVISLAYPASFIEPAEQHVSSATGTVSSPSVDAELDPSLPHYSSAILHSAIITLGNSGGPLVDAFGNLVGINTLGNTHRGGRIVRRRGYAISIDRIKSLLPRLEAGHNNDYLGWSLFPLSELDLGEFLAANGFVPELEHEEAEPKKFGEVAERYFHARRIDGLIVDGKPDPGSAADRAHLGESDLVVTVDKKPVTSVGDVCDILASRGSGEPVSVDGKYVASGYGEPLHDWSGTFEIQND